MKPGYSSLLLECWVYDFLQHFEVNFLWLVNI